MDYLSGGRRCGGRNLTSAPMARRPSAVTPSASWYWAFGPHLKVTATPCTLRAEWALHQLDVVKTQPEQVGARKPFRFGERQRHERLLCSNQRGIVVEALNHSRRTAPNGGVGSGGAQRGLAGSLRSAGLGVHARPRGRVHRKQCCGDRQTKGRRWRHYHQGGYASRDAARQ